MAQNEEMKRLRLKGKIVGYQSQVDGLIMQATELSLVTGFFASSRDILISQVQEDGQIKHLNWIHHDSYDPGIKVGDDWWFEGDRIEAVESPSDINKWIGIIRYNKCSGCFNIKWSFNKLIRITDMFGMIGNYSHFHIFKHIGNIHQEESK